MSRVARCLSNSCRQLPARTLIPATTMPRSLAHNKAKASTAKPSKRGAEAYNARYKQLYGERWPALLKAMLQPTRHVALLNKHCGTVLSGETRYVLKQQHACEIISELSIPCMIEFSAADQSKQTKSSSKPYPPPTHFVTTLPSYTSNTFKVLPYYLMDLASVLAVQLLDVTAATRVLDVCSAPGGKAVAITQQLPPTAQLHVNELSRTRRGRLTEVIKQYTSPTQRESITITGFDATRHIFAKESYDRILLDAPCSSSRHCLHDATELDNWSESQIDRCSDRQFQILLHAIRALAVGGRLVYATCSLDSKENDEVVAKMLKRINHDDEQVVVRTAELAKLKFTPSAEGSQLTLGRSTQHGWMICPDDVAMRVTAGVTDSDTQAATLGSGFGPLYTCVLERVRSDTQRKDDSDSDNADLHSSQSSSEGYSSPASST